MPIRVLQLINNFYRDSGYEKEENRETPLGKFCVLGYFDALDVKIASDIFEEEVKAWDVLGALSMDKPDGAVSRRNIVCVPIDGDRDRQFWDENNALPFYFISMLRVNKERSPASRMIQDMEKLENDDQDTITYCTYNHSEAVIVKRTGSYSEGMEHIVSLRDRFSAFKVYSILAIRESTLNSYTNITQEIKKEQIDCRLRCVVKSYKEAEKFLKELKDALTKYEGGKIRIRRYDTLGAYDWIIEIDDISIRSILRFYKMGEILTHTNSLFESAFFNIETEIFVPEEVK